MARQYWLFKSDPDTFGLSHLKRCADRQTMWDGVRNFQARNLLRDKVKVGDGVLFYHSQIKPPAVVATANVTREAYPDPTQFKPKEPYYDARSDPGDPRWFAVDIQLDKELVRAVTLPEMREAPGLEEMVLLHRSRLSIQPVTAGTVEDHPRARSPLSEPALAAAAVSKFFGQGVRALCEVTFDVGAGETVALIGESGSGKTTLLRMFNRLEEPSQGTVWIDGRLAAEVDPIELRRSTGYVQQEGGLLPHWSVERNVELVPRLLGWSAERCRERADELLRVVGLPPEEYRSRYPRELSGGQRQRVAFARALAADPGVILLDEPFGALDALTRVELQREFQGLQQRLSKTMLLVTHDLGEAFRLADRVGVMRGGRLLQLASPAELRASPADDYVRRLIEHTPGVSA